MIFCENLSKAADKDAVRREITVRVKFL